MNAFDWSQAIDSWPNKLTRNKFLKQKSFVYFRDRKAEMIAGS